MIRIRCSLGFAFAIWFVVTSMAQAESVARLWNEANLAAIRIDFPAPTAHGRNLYHTASAIYDAWAAYDAVAEGHFYSEKHSAFDANAARHEAISYAAYRVLSQRYSIAIDPESSQDIFDGLMDRLGYDQSITTTQGDTPAAVGNRIADQILTTALEDGANEANRYADPTGYAPVNPPMVVDFPRVVGASGSSLEDANRWQPLFLESAVTQNGLVGETLQEFIDPHWGDVTTFALGRGTDEPSWQDVDPGPPPQLNGLGDAEYRSDTVLLLEYSQALDPTQGAGAERINVSPNENGNRILGSYESRGYAVNPVTRLPYDDNWVKTADYGRILAEFWADGPESETPPGHWNVLANEVSDHPLFEKRMGGTGPILGDLEWDVKMYLALNGAVHDAGIAAWGTKRAYDYVRPITKIRYQGGLGQSSDPSGPSYHPDGLPLQADTIELITAESIAEGGRHRNAFNNANQDPQGNFKLIYSASEMVGKVVVKAWNHEPDNPVTQLSGVDWILAENWVPFQDDNFVTPAFAAYVSGHSAFSRAGAEVLAELTGTEFFPGGVGEVTFDTTFLDFEKGPSEPVTLQWATYYDAADEAGISRLWGGIHVPVDDKAGRVIGAQVGKAAVDYALDVFVADDLDWHNRATATDTNNDGIVSPLDALLCINELSNRVVSDPITGALPDIEGVPLAFIDVDGNHIVSPLDALLIINELPSNSNSISNSRATSARQFSTVVPEPASRSLLVLTGLGCLFCRRLWE